MVEDRPLEPPEKSENLSKWRLHSAVLQGLFLQDGLGAWLPLHTATSKALFLKELVCSGSSPIVFLFIDMIREHSPSRLENLSS